MRSRAPLAFTIVTGRLLEIGSGGAALALIQTKKKARVLVWLGAGFQVAGAKELCLKLLTQPYQ
jgi:hypothetical protein